MLCSRYNFTPTEDEKSEIFKIYDENLTIPNNFIKTTKGHCNDEPKKSIILQPSAIINPQTTKFCQILNIDDPIEKLKALNPNNSLNNSELFNTSLNSTSFIDDTELSIKDFDLPDDEPASFSILKSPLKLPDPKETSCHNLIEKNVTKPKENIELIEDKNVSLSEELDGITPEKKKFKRRNANIYENDTSN